MSDENYEIRVKTEVISKSGNAVQRDLLYVFSNQVGNGTKTSDFSLQITDPDDPLFLYDFELTAAQFQKIKKEQKLFCEFAGFPKSIYSLLNQIITSEDYKALIDEHEFELPTLMLQQVTHISLLIHLQLPLIEASDSRLKEFLSKETRFYKTTALQASQKLQEAEKEMEQQRKEYEAKIQKLNDLALQKASEFEAEKARMRKEFEARIEQVKSEQETAKQFLDQGFVSKEQAIVAKYESQIGELRNALQNSINEKHKIDMIAQRQAEKIGLLESHVSELKEKLSNTESDSRTAASQVIEHTKREASLRAEIESLKVKLQSANEIIKERKQREESNENTVEGLRASLEMKEQEIENMKQEIEELSAKASDRDFIANKSKDVIQKVQAKLKAAVTELAKSKTTENQLRVALDASMSREKEAEENVRRMSVTLEQEKHQLKEAMNENARVKEQVRKLEIELSTEKQYAGFLNTQLKRKDDLKAFGCKTAQLGTVLAQEEQTDAVSPPKVAEKPRSIPAAFLAVNDSVPFIE